jgi:O-antigen/teichoic acid export membrane protein
MILPSDYGEVALVLTFNQIANLFVQSGLGDGLIYNAKNSRKMYSTVFFLNISIALILYLLIVAFSGAVSNFYEIPRLAVLMKVVCLNIVIFSLSYVQRCILIIDLEFKKYATISLISSIIGSTIGIVLAFRGFGIWALVLMTLSINTIDLLQLWIRSKWKPSFAFSIKEISHILPYSIRIMLNNLLQTIYDNIYSLVIGKVYNTKSLGYYNRMQTVTYFTTTNLLYSIESVFFPVLSKRKDEVDLSVSYEKLFRFSLFLSLPILVILIALAKPIIVLILTSNWIGGVPYLQLTAIAFLFVPILYVNNLFLKIANHTKALFYSNLIKKIIGITILIALIRYDILVLCAGIVGYYCLDSLISMICVAKYVKIPFLKQFSFMRNNILMNGVCFVLVWYIEKTINNILMSAFWGVASYFLVYFLMAFIFKTEEWSLLRIVISRLFPSKNK